MAAKKHKVKNEYSDARMFIDEIVHVRIDRPLGSRHPAHDCVYSVNYGFVPGVPGLDGEELDAYVLGVDEPVECYTGRCIAVVRRLNDADDKLVVVPNGTNCTDDQIRDATKFQERFFESVIQR